MAYWTVRIEGEALDLAELERISPACGCSISVDNDNRHFLRSEELECHLEVREVRAAAEKLLMVLNGIARLSHPDHRPVKVGSAVIRNDDQGRKHIALLIEPIEIRARFGDVSLTVKTPEGTVVSSAQTAKEAEARRIAKDPELRRVVEILSSDLSWQKLRLAYEALCALVGDEQALKQRQYFTLTEGKTFKANCHDPRLNGDEALHFPPWNGAPERKMSVREGHQFLTGILRNILRETGV